LRADGFQTVATKELLVGDIVQIKDGEEITADILPLSTNNPGGICSVETSNLDGYVLIYSTSLFLFWFRCTVTTLQNLH